MNFIYLTTNLKNGKQYVGSHNGSINDSYLGSGKILKYAIKKHGKENFKREILEECSIEFNLILEEKYINQYNTLYPNGYNLNKTGGFTIFSTDLKNKLSNGKKGKTQSIESNEKRRQSMLGKNIGPKTEETKRKISESKKGKIPWNKGIVTPIEIKEKLSKSHKGKKLSDETKLKMSVSRTGIKLSEDHKRKISVSHKGDKNPMYGKTPWNKK